MSDLEMWEVKARVRVTALDPCVVATAEAGVRRAGAVGKIAGWTMAPANREGLVVPLVPVYRVEHDDGTEAWYAGWELGQP